VVTVKLRIVAVLLLVFLSINVAAAAEPVVYYKFDGDFTDSAGSNDGTNNGGTSFDIGYWNQSGSFDGVNDYVYLDTTSYTDNFTVSLWIYPRDTSKLQTLWAQDFNQLGIDVGGNVLFQKGGTWESIKTRGNSINIDKWHHITFVKNGNNIGDTQIYINGNLAADDAAIPELNSGSGHIGGNTPWNPFFGNIDDFKIYDRALTESEISELYQNSPRNAVVISAYNEINETQLNISDFIIYNENQSISSGIVIDGDYYVYSNQFTELGQYIASIDAQGYYQRNIIVENSYIPFIANTYLIPEDEIVIYNTFKIITNAAEYDYDKLILRIDKPLSNSTDIIYSSYFDFQGTTATYLLPDENYLLYIITPDETINYGWLTPDADGLIEIGLHGITIDSYSDDWYGYSYYVSGEMINLEYSSLDTISTAHFIVSNSTTEKYNVIAETDSGSFNYVIESNETLNVYFELIRADGTKISDFWIIPGSEAEKTVFPESYPQWLKNSVVTALAILCILGFSSYRVEVGMALGVGIVSVAYLWGEYEINESTGYTVALLAFIVIIEFVIQQRKEAVR